LTLTAKQQEALDAFAAHGSKKGAARALGIDEKTLRKHLQAAERKLDPAIQESMAAVGTDLVPALAWAKTKSQDGTSYSVLLKPPVADIGETIDRIADRFNRILAAPEIKRPIQTRDDMLGFVPIFDLHLGMRAGSYGTAQAVDRLRAGFRDVIDRSPPASTIIILNGGDFTEANDNSALTPANKHPLAVDMDYEDIADIATDLTVDLVEYALSKADRVEYQALRANHDPATSIMLRQGLRMRYRDNPRFALHDGHDLFTREWEGNLIAAVHGDQKVSKPETLTLAIAARHAAAWGASKRREFWQGHHHKEMTVNVPGMRLYRVNPICPPGRYANQNLFTGESDIQCVTYGKGGGRRATTVHIFDD
jgi:hypothetical protein